MKIASCELTNFCSYEHLCFDYNDLGLALISGATGVGKSTVMDGPAWVLYGITSKDSAADDVRSWAGGPTFGTVEVWLSEFDFILVTRERGSTNDLFWIEGGSDTPVRGKDLKDTQRLLEARLGVSAELFLIGSYMHQFSKADAFFIASAKDRREVLEKIADQDFAVTLGSKASEARKSAKQEAQRLSSDLSLTTGRLEGSCAALKTLEMGRLDWDASQSTKIVKLEFNIVNFDEDLILKAAARKAAAHEWALTQQELMADAETKIDNYAEEIAAKDAEIALRAEQWLDAQSVKAERLATLAAEQEALLDASPATSEKERARIAASIAALKDSKCVTCGQANAATARAELQARLMTVDRAIADDKRAGALLTSYNKQLDALANEENPHRRNPPGENPYIKVLAGYSAQVNPHLAKVAEAANPYIAQLKDAKAEVNPFSKRILHTQDFIAKDDAAAKTLSANLAVAEKRVNNLTWLYDKSFELRGLLMKRAVSQIEDQTNSYLEKYFDAALRVQFSLAGSDKLEVEINNDGHSAPFRQLSGGERCLLKLAFSLSLMRAAQDRAGVSFGTVMLDEALNGLDDGLKVKAFGLLQQLETEYSTVLCIDHSDELKAQFTRRFSVTKDSGHSTLVED